MFACKWNEFKDYRKEEQQPPLSEKELMERIDKMADVVFPAMSERTKAIVEKQKGDFDTKHKL
ncbi:hypothetical protein DFQ29_001205, partial [Apophysomyces sp. BC1021]